MRSSSPNSTAHNAGPGGRQSPWRIRLPLAAPTNRIVRPRARTVAGARIQIERALNAGDTAVCPITGKLIEIYRRGLHQGQVFMLRRLARASRKLGKTYLHLEFFTGRRDGDFAKLAAWGLAERLRPATRLEGEQCRGWWKITDLGRRWLAGRVRIPRQMAIVGNVVIGPVDRRDTIAPRDCPSRFDREQLAAGRDGFERTVA